MKKFAFFAIIVLLLTACSSTQEPVKPVETRTVYRDVCNTCSSSYTVRKPVEVIYEDTTYTTVYEPKTYTSTKYVRKPYDNCEKENFCK